MKLRLLEVVLVILAIHPPSEIDRKVRTALCTQNGRSSLVQVLEFRTPSVTLGWTYWRDVLCPEQIAGTHHFEDIFSMIHDARGSHFAQTPRNCGDC